MKPELQRIAIAEACGFRHVKCPTSSLSGEDPHNPAPMTYWREPKLWDEFYTIGLPDYLNDLNAMHEAEKVLDTPEKWQGYGEELALVAWRDRQIAGTHIEMNRRSWIHATAAQRAEAFLRTIGKWEKPHATP